MGAFLRAGSDALQEGLQDARQPRRFKVRLVQSQHARRQPEPLAVGGCIVQVFQRQQATACGGTARSEMIAAQAAPIITVADAMQSLRTAEALRRSIVSGQTVAVQALT